MIEITNLDHNGKGIARLNNKIVFVENALPGEKVDINIVSEKKNYANAKVTKYINESPDRINVKCPYYDFCGGCDILHLSYDKQLKFKEEKIKNIISKYVNSSIKVNEIIKSDLTINYRNKITLKVKNNKIGFYEKNSHNLIEIDNCLLADNKINSAIKYLKELNLNSIDEITLRVANNKLMIIISSKEKNTDISKLNKIADSIYIKFNNNYYLAWKDKYIYENIDDYKFSILPDAFFQVNINVCKKLYKYIKDNINDNSNVLDLYCGTGSIGIFVNKNNNVLGIEINEQAIKNAIENKKINNLDNIDFILGDSTKKLNDINYKPDTIIVDPPRNGLTNEVISNIINLNPKKVIYVSCDPMTLSRDLNSFIEAYEISSITPFDMFPNTHHVETITILERK